MSRTDTGGSPRWRGPRARASAVVLTAVAAAVALFAIAGAAPVAATATVASGELYGFGEHSPTPTLVTLAGATGQVTEAAAGDGYSLAVTSSGQLYAFGDNHSGQLGSTTNNGTQKPDATPTAVVLPGATGPVAQVAAGAAHSLVVTSTGQLYAFGENSDGQLGNRTHTRTEIPPNPTPRLVTLPGATGPASQVAAGGEDSLVVTATGQLYGFGDNTEGQLGTRTNNIPDGDTDPLAEPNPTPTLVKLHGATGPVSQIAAGGDHSLALTSTGQLFAFGDNFFGQLGSTTKNVLVGANPTPALVKLPGATGPISQIAAGGDHSLVLTSTGQLYAFGNNDSGQLGTAAPDVANPTPMLVTLPGATGAPIEVAAGYVDSLVVTSTGQLFTLGGNQQGQLGTAANSQPNPLPTLVTFPEGALVSTAAPGALAEHTLALAGDLELMTDMVPAGSVGVPYTSSAEAIGGSAPYTWSAAGLPAGLSSSPVGGQITGTPTSAGAANVTLTATDATGLSAVSRVIPMTIAPLHPLLSAVSLTNRRFRIGAGATAIKATGPPVGSTFRLTLSPAAEVQVVIRRALCRTQSQAQTRPCP